MTFPLKGGPYREIFNHRSYSMKFVILAIAIALSFFTLPRPAHASLKASVQSNWYDSAKNDRFQYGLNWYQPLGFQKRLALNSFLGYGTEPFELKGDIDWTVFKTQLDIIYKRFTLSPGYAYKHTDPLDISRDYAYIKLEYKILD